MRAVSRNLDDFVTEHMVICAANEPGQHPALIVCKHARVTGTKRPVRESKEGGDYVRGGEIAIIYFVPPVVISHVGTDASIPVAGSVIRRTVY